ncbi:MAG: HNH endonuclease [Prevotella sp.]
MEALCIKLKSVLERHFSMPFEVSSSLVDGEEHYTCSPSNEGAMFFDVRVYIHNHIRLVIEIYPQKHGGYILKDMASTEVSKRKRFEIYKEMLEDKGAKIVFLVNGSNIFTNEWPELWRSFMCKIVLVPISDSDSSEKEFSVISEWLKYCFEFIFSLLTITDINDKGDNITSIQTEGTPTEIRSIRYERNPINRQLCLHRKGYNCAVCGMNFYDIYGKIGYHYIEVHHTTPVSAMTPGYVFDVDRDLVPLCSNCHAMVHRRTPPYTVEELKGIIKK